MRDPYQTETQFPRISQSMPSHILCCCCGTISVWVYAIGGDGTMRGAVAIFKEFKQHGLRISITWIPKTVDIGIIDKSFVFQTAVEIT
uniref:Phosphofructokinase domain-containing protein n=1 Tax=Aegilops tauschii subsp. strangulata TaxID=200361 RepID=A0A452YF97_AEGTS